MSTLLPMIAILITIFLAVIDFSMIISMLPFIAQELHISSSDSIWIINIYQLTMFSTLIFFSKLSKKIGYKYLFIFGLLIFIAGSFLCYKALNFKEILIFRTIQSIGVSVLTSINIAMIKNIYTAKKVGKGIALSAFTVAIASSLGPIVSSFLITNYSWNYIFLINIPIGLFSFLLSILYIKSDHYKYQKNVLSKEILFYPIIYFSLGLSIVLISQLNNLFFIPLLLLLFFRNMLYKVFQIKFMLENKLGISLLTTLIFFFSQSLSFTTLPFYLHQILLKPINLVSFYLTIWAISVAIFAFSSGYLSHQFSPKLISGIGAILFTLGLVVLFLTNSSTPSKYITCAVSLCGMGFGLFQSSNVLHIMNTTSSDDSALTSGILSTVRLLAQLSGAALFAFLLLKFQNNGLKHSLLIALFSSSYTIFLCFKALELKNFEQK